MMEMTKELEKSEMWQMAVRVMEETHALAEELPENDEYTMEYKLRQRGFDLSDDIAEAEGSIFAKDTEYYLGLARRDLFGIRNMYHVLARLEHAEINPDVMVRMNKLLNAIDARIVLARKEISSEEQRKTKSKHES